ncbi:hypothetical protein TNCV_2864241, partial [Trichonephila clavipes]
TSCNYLKPRMKTPATVGTLTQTASTPATVNLDPTASTPTQPSTRSGRRVSSIFHLRWSLTPWKRCEAFDKLLSSLLDDAFRGCWFSSSTICAAKAKLFPPPSQSSSCSVQPTMRLLASAIPLATNDIVLDRMEITFTSESIEEAASATIIAVIKKAGPQVCITFVHIAQKNEGVNKPCWIKRRTLAHPSPSALLFHMWTPSDYYRGTSPRSLTYNTVARCSSSLVFLQSPPKSPDHDCIALRHNRLIRSFTPYKESFWNFLNSKSATHRRSVFDEAKRAFGHRSPSDGKAVRARHCLAAKIQKFIVAHRSPLSRLHEPPNVLL